MKIDNAQKIIAFIFRRSGKEKISKSDLYLTLSMDLKWTNPHKAKTFIEQLIKNGYLSEKQNKLQPTFEYKNITIPLGYHPNESDFTEEIIKDENKINELINHLINKTQKNVDEINKEIEKIAIEKNITFKVAMLLYSKKHNIAINNHVSIIK